MKEANETLAFMFGKTKEDKMLFVKNLGWLFSQTRDSVSGCEYLPDRDVVQITYRDGYTQYVNVAMDSYAAIVRDVARMIG